MANEIRLEDSSGAQPPQGDAGTMDAGQTADGANAAATGGDAGAPAGTETPDYKAEVEKLQATTKELQSQFTKVSQDHARSQELLRTLEPYIDYSRIQGGQPGQAPGAQPTGEAADADAETYLTKKDVKQLLEQQANGFRQELIAQNARTKYPDMCDNGPKEVIVRWHLQNKTSPHEPAEKRIERAVEMSREFIKAEREAGKKEADDARKKTEDDAKKKAAAAAQMSGTAATGPTSPASGTPQTNEEMTGDNYVNARRTRRAQTQTVAP